LTANAKTNCSITERQDTDTLVRGRLLFLCRHLWLDPPVLAELLIGNHGEAPGSVASGDERPRPSR
jgi:hypothetical protein